MVIATLETGKQWDSVFDHWLQIRKETEKAFVPKVVISATKAKEQETRITGEMTLKQEQKQITQETVSPALCVLQTAHFQPAACTLSQSFRPESLLSLFLLLSACV